MSSPSSSSVSPTKPLVMLDIIRNDIEEAKKERADEEEREELYRQFALNDEW
jgi:hypothetical protein